MIKLHDCKTPGAIEAQSFAIIDAEITNKIFAGPAWAIARRLVHTSGDLELVSQLVLPETAIQAGLEALRRKAPIFTDTEMACHGIPKRRLLALGTQARCLLSLPGCSERAQAEQITRSRAAMLAAAPLLPDAIVAIGNAPTALLALLELLAQGLKAPALIIGMPVGFVNAAEAKALLCQSPWPHLSIRGRKGGSPLAAAAVNALAELLLNPTGADQHIG